MVYAIDFDGTLCSDAFPSIGEPINKMIAKVKSLKREGHKIILWTCRSGKQLEEAVKWCSNQGINFDAINDNLIEHIEKYNNNCRKVYADYYIDDKNIILRKM